MAADSAVSHITAPMGTINCRRLNPRQADRLELLLTWVAILLGLEVICDAKEAAIALAAWLAEVHDTLLLNPVEQQEHSGNQGAEAPVAVNGGWQRGLACLIPLGEWKTNSSTNLQENKDSRTAVTDKRKPGRKPSQKKEC